MLDIDPTLLFVSDPQAFGDLVLGVDLTRLMVELEPPKELSPLPLSAKVM